MGVVWKAEDSVLGRTVAIKVLPAGADRDEQRRKMFLDEARLASSVSEAHIVQVYEFGREGDLDFIVMEYVEGKPLSKLLNGRALPPDKVAGMGLQAAQALSSAHRKGLLHRDIKPANLLVTSGGDVKEVDFGLAMLFERGATRVGEDDATSVGKDEPGGGSGGNSLSGTLPYMSPEQVRSEKLDARSDIFSLGVVLYEMTTGQRPFSGATQAALLQEILQARPKPVHELVPKVPLDLDRVIQKALAPKQGDRYQTMEDLAVDLKRLGRDLESGSSPSWDELKKSLAPERRRRLWRAGLAAAVVLVVAGVAAWLTRSHWGTTPPDPHTVLILPMEVRGQTEGADYVGRAFAETIAVSLARAKNMTILPVPEAGGPGKGGSPEAVRAALVLRAGRLLTGALTRDGEALQASLSLLDTQANRILWGTTKPGKSGDLGALAYTMAREAATELGGVFPRQYDPDPLVTCSPAMAASLILSEAIGAQKRNDLPAFLASTARLVEAFPNEPEALVLRAYALDDDAWNSPPSSPKRKAFEESLQAIERVDPKNPWKEFLRAWSLDANDSRYQEAVERFSRLLDRDDLTPAARARVLTLRAQSFISTGDIAASLADLQESTRLDPTSYGPFQILSRDLLLLGRFEESLQRARQAVALAPGSSNALLMLTDPLVAVGRLEEALEATRAAMSIDPANVQNNWGLGEVLGRLGRHEEATVPLSRACDIAVDQAICALYATALWQAGHMEKARTIAAAAAIRPETDFGAYRSACYKAVTGDREGALRLLRRYLELNAGPDPQVATDPNLASLHGDPVYEAIIAELERRRVSLNNKIAAKP